MRLNSTKAVNAAANPQHPEVGDIFFKVKDKAVADNERMRSKGFKPFPVNGKIVWAINEKNARRKG
jgi:hypothetical protein